MMYVIKMMQDGISPRFSKIITQGKNRGTQGKKLIYKFTQGKNQGKNDSP